jgi:hypothetical protein
LVLYPIPSTKPLSLRDIVRDANLRRIERHLCIAIPLGSLPRTFRDAVTLTLDLGIYYLRIASLFIIQNSPDDWLREALQRSTVYYNSQVTITATSSADSQGGLFYLETLHRRPCLLDATWTGTAGVSADEDERFMDRHKPVPLTLFPGRYDVFGENQFYEVVANGPLNQKTRVLQEELLLPKNIHCAVDQL